MASAYWITGDTLATLRDMPTGSVDLVMTSPPFLALRSYLPADDPAKALEIGQEGTPGAFLDVLLDITEELRRVLAPHGSICVELGDTYSGSGGGGGDYSDGGMRDGQPKFDGSGKRVRTTRREGFIADDIQPPPRRDTSEGWPEAKSACLIPELYRISLAYGVNPLTGRTTPRWRVRNTVRWVRPNPPVGALGDKFRPATSDMVIATMARDRYFDLDAVRVPFSEKTNQSDRVTTDGAEARAAQGGRPRIGPQINTHAGAPPLDWWEIPTHPEEVTGLRVPCGPHDGGERTVSPDCPVHGDQIAPRPTARRGERAGSRPKSTPRTDAHPALELGLDSAPTPSTTAQTGSSPASSPSGAPAASPHSSAGHRTDPAPSTIPADTPSARTAAGTAGTSASPESSEPGHDTPESSTSAVGSSGSPTSRTNDDTAGTDTRRGSSEACTCSYSIAVDDQSTGDYAGYPSDYWVIPTQPYRGSHYATFPGALVEKPIKAMCPAKVCTVCGKPSERIVGEAEYVNSRTGKPVTTLHLRDGEHIPGQGNAVDSTGQGDRAATRVAPTLGWTDCGCPGGDTRWRNGRVLDIFGGSGTTLAVATGHGRDAIGIDLDARNVDLARERIGPMFFHELTVAELAEVLS